MTDLNEILTDLEAEVGAFTELISDLSDDQWLTPTPAEGWDVLDTVSHVADTDDLAYDCATNGPRDLLEEAIAAGSADAFTLGQVLKGRGRPPSEILDWYRNASTRLGYALRQTDPGSRIKWGPNVISPVSFATARLMETWAHGLDIRAAVGAEPQDGDRLRHIAFLGLRALPYALSHHGIVPGPVRLEIEAPSGEAWTFGPADAPTRIQGSAADWCRVATKRDRSDERSRLSFVGPDADAIRSHVQAYL